MSDENLAKRKTLYGDLKQYFGGGLDMSKFGIDKPRSFSADAAQDRQEKGIFGDVIGGGGAVAGMQQDFISRAVDLGIDPEAFSRTAARAKAEAASDKQNQGGGQSSYDNFFNRNTDSRSLSQRRRRVYTRRDGLKLAKKLRKAGFASAANRVAYDWASSSEARLPSTATPAMREQMELDFQKEKDAQRLQDRLLRQMVDRMEADPDYKPDIFRMR
tara:strand:- start:2296 stop:2943 length:648 start_codon:yes stop_codon:yes gene_type:complete